MKTLEKLVDFSEISDISVNGTMYNKWSVRKGFLSVAGMDFPLDKEVEIRGDEILCHSTAVCGTDYRFETRLKFYTYLPMKIFNSDAKQGCVSHPIVHLRYAKNVTNAQILLVEDVLTKQQWDPKTNSVAELVENVKNGKWKIISYCPIMPEDSEMQLISIHDVDGVK